MQNIHLTMLSDTTFEAVVDNSIVAKEFTDLTPVIQNYLRTRLKNRKLTMKVRVSELSERPRAYSRVEKYQMRVQKNKALQQLTEEFGLEFS